MPKKKFLKFFLKKKMRPSRLVNNRVELLLPERRHLHHHKRFTIRWMPVRIIEFFLLCIIIFIINTGRIPFLSIIVKPINAR